MRVAVLGGTRFIGRAVVDALVEDGDEVLVCHRGVEHCDASGPVAHLHCERSAMATDAHARSRLRSFGAEAVVDCMALSANDVRAAFDALDPDGPRWVVLSSQDVYRAFATVQHELPATDDVPIDEDAPLRSDRYPYRDNERMADYSKIDVEELVLPHGAVVLRLPMVYGPHDYQRREEFVLRRVRAGRTRIPVGSCDALFPFGFVEDVARGVPGALHAPDAQVRGEVFNLAEWPVGPVSEWIRRILDAARSRAELVQVDEQHLSEDLGMAGATTQPLVMSSEKARSAFGYTDTEKDDAVARSVAWHLAHPPDQSDADFSADDRALATAEG